jgi:hypothetical protein
VGTYRDGTVLCVAKVCKCGVISLTRYTCDPDINAEDVAWRLSILRGVYKVARRNVQVCKMKCANV